MSKLIAAHTNPGAEYPGYINFTRENDGSITVYFRGNPTKADGSAHFSEGANAILTLANQDFQDFINEVTRFLRIATETTEPDAVQTKDAQSIRAEALRDAAKMIRSGAGMCDLIDDDLLDQQAKNVLLLIERPLDPLIAETDLSCIEEPATAIRSLGDRG